MLDRSTKDKLRSLLGARLLGEDSAGFDASRQIWNAMIDARPSAIAQCVSAAEVSATLRIACDAGLAISVRGGGHNIAGTAVSDGALMIDLSLMQGVDVDVAARVVVVGGGATWAHVDAITQRHGLAAPGGVVSSTGVAGLTLGGGFGWLARRHGLAIDNLLEVDMVLADGRQVAVSDETHPELFWAIRGGGANFGVATRFKFRLHAVGPQVLHGPTFFALDDAPRVLAAYAELADGMPREACVWANLMTAPPVPVLPQAVHGTKVLTLMQFYAGDVDDGKKQLETLYGGARPLGSALAPRPFVEAQSFMDAAYEFGARNYWRTHNHLELTPALLDTLVNLTPGLPTPASELLICHLGGAIADTPAGATAYPHRDVPFMSTPGVRWDDARDDAQNIDWLRNASLKIAEHAVPGKYVNFIAEPEGEAAYAYGVNFARLAELKRRYDPDNLFRSNQNVAPQA